MKNKIITAGEAVALVKSNNSLMVGGFLQCGTPTLLVEELLKTDVHNLTLIANDTCFIDSDRGKLIVNKKVKKAIVTHIGTNPETGRQMQAGELDVELVPQGTMAERIHAGGSGLGGVLTPTGIGTLVEEGKTVVTINDKKYILETPLHANIAFIYGSRVDKFGNIAYHGTTRNFNTIMALAADIVIVEAEQYQEEALNPDEVIVPGIFVDYIVKRG